MTDYQLALILGLGLVLFGGARYALALVNGETGTPSVFVMVAGAVSLIYADQQSGSGVSINDVYPAVTSLLSSVGGAVF